MTRILACYGTRPEKIKLEPVISALRKRGADVETWFSGQSRDLVSETLGQTRHTTKFVPSLTCGISHNLLDINLILGRNDYDCVIVQGDTATAFACALAAYLADVPVAHVEAGLRTYRRDPWPEEAFRGMIARLATWHFCPDKVAASNLLAEVVGGRRVMCPTGDSRVGDEWCPEFTCKCNGFGIFIVGNTIIDTLPIVPFRVLVTLHRRENWGNRIYDSLIQLSAFKLVHEDLSVLINAIRHPNWKNHLYNTTGLHMIDPVSHNDLLDLMLNSAVVVTDSGGLQEEAAHFGIPCIVVREATERVALLSTGAVRLVNPDKPQELREALESELAKRTQYGDGHAGEAIAKILMEDLDATT